MCHPADILVSSGYNKPAALEKLIKNGATTASGTVLTESAIHGHHIVMKRGGGWYGARARGMLKKYGIDLLETKDKLKSAVEAKDELHNMAMALNGYKGIHSKAYSKAVYERLKKAVDDGVSDADITQRIAEELKKMKAILENGKTFW